MPGYGSPSPAPPPVINQPIGLGAPIGSSTTQARFRPVPPSARLGGIEAEEAGLPLPPADGSKQSPGELDLQRGDERLPYITQK
jgi:hypothetical protein